MIINKIKIDSFGGIKNKSIDFNDGLNLIYGENEAGKSTIQNFIKIWLYGFANTRIKSITANERLKYMPMTGENISGELYVSQGNKQYIIRRTFAKNKKDDTAIIVDALTGEDILDINAYEPGKDILGINRVTFSNTLFISQLGVEVKKDKEEEILDKISQVLGVGDGNITIDKAFTKLETYKKNISNNRNTGELNLLNQRYAELVNERYEGYKLSEHSIENENELIRLKKFREDLNKEIENLEIYKKYLKKSKLQKEYEEITDYLRKKEELQEKEKTISSEITFNSRLLTNEFIGQIKDEYSLYLSLLDLKNEDEEKLQQKREKLKAYEEDDEFQRYFNAGSSIRNEIEKIKLQNESFNEKKISINKIKKEIKVLEQKKHEGEKLVGNAIKLKPYKEELQKDLKEYEKKLSELKNKAENKTDKKIIILLVAVAVFSGVISAIAEPLALKILFALVPFFAGLIYVLNKYVLKSGSNYRMYKLNKQIEEIEESLNKYMVEVQTTEFNELFKKYNLYLQFEEFGERINKKIEEKEYQLNYLAENNFNFQYENNNEKIKEILNKYNCSSLEALLEKVDYYEEEKNNYKIIQIHVNSEEENLDKINGQLLIREEKIREKLAQINKGDIDILQVEEVLSSLKEKINLMEDIKRSLESVESTYELLAKDKNIDNIKDELKDIIKVNFKYSYEKEEEIDLAIKEKTNNLLNTEKKIKDIQYEIESRFSGKRRIPEIEEEILEVKEKINLAENKLKASEIALKVLKESYDEIRNSFGPKLNNEVADIFSSLSGGRYSEVMVSDKYEMKVKKENGLLSSEHLSNGANDQLYLSLRLAFIRLIFKDKDIAVFLDDAFVQYDDIRTEYILKYLVNERFKQSLVFTCQNRESLILNNNNIGYNYIKL